MNTVHESQITDPELVVLGRINGVFGTRGWLKIYSYTRPRDNIFAYPTWYLARDSEWRAFKLGQHKAQGNSLVAALLGIDDRDQALSWLQSDIAIQRQDLPASTPGDYYWVDLIGLEVSNVAGTQLGRVSQLLDTGANDVLVVCGERERLIPFVLDVYVLEVDLANKRLVVDWHADD